MLELKRNPWLGLSSYQVEDAALFFGRGKEVEFLDAAIRKNYSTIIYGKSGMGKTSLINAGLIPSLRREGFLSLSIKLVHDGAVGYARQITEAVMRGLAEAGAEVENRAAVREVSERSGLWAFFHLNDFWSADNHRLIPVVFIDQFEEIFTMTADKSAAAEFFSMLGELFQPLPPDEVNEMMEKSGRRIDFSETANFRLVLAMREDFLARLEDYSYDIPLLRRNRVGLSAMNGLQSLEVMMSPVPGLVDREAALGILRKITRSGQLRDDDGQLRSLSVETFLLSLFCSQLYRKAAELGRDRISQDLIERFGDNIINDYYAESVSGISKKSLRYLEEHLLTASGYRNMLAYEDVVPRFVSAAEIASLEKCRLIRIEVVNRTERIEFTHDVLCSVATDRKISRRMKKDSWSRAGSVLCNVVDILSVVLLFVLLFVASGDFWLGGSSSVMRTLAARLSLSGTLLSLLPWLSLLMTLAVIWFSSLLRSAMVSSRSRSPWFSLFASGFDLLVVNAAVLFYLALFVDARDWYVLWFVIRSACTLADFVHSMRKKAKVPFARMWRSAVRLEEPMAAGAFKVLLLVSYLFLLCLCGRYMRPDMGLFLLLCLVPAMSLALPFRRNIFREKKLRPLLAGMAAAVIALYLSRYLRPVIFAWGLFVLLLPLSYAFVSYLMPAWNRWRRLVPALGLWLLVSAGVPMLAAGYNFLTPSRCGFVRGGVIYGLDDMFRNHFVLVRNRDGEYGAVDRCGRTLLPPRFESLATVAEYRLPHGTYYDESFHEIVFSLGDEGGEVSLLDYIEYDNWYSRMAREYVAFHTGWSDLAETVREELGRQKVRAGEDASSEPASKVASLYSSRRLHELLSPEAYITIAGYYRGKGESDLEYAMLSKALQTRMALDSSGVLVPDYYPGAMSLTVRTVLDLVAGTPADGLQVEYGRALSDRAYRNFIREVLVDTKAGDFCARIVDGGRYDGPVLRALQNDYSLLASGNSKFNERLKAVLMRSGESVTASYLWIHLGEYAKAMEMSRSLMDKETDSSSFLMAATNYVGALLFLGRHDEARAFVDRYGYHIAEISSDHAMSFRDLLLMDLKHFEELGIIPDEMRRDFGMFAAYLEADEEHSYSQLLPTPYGVYWAGDELVQFGWNRPGVMWLLDAQGERISADFEDVFVNGADSYDLAYDPVVIYVRDGKRGFYDLSSRACVTGAEYDHAWVFSEGLAAVVKDGRLGFIDRRGGLAIPFVLDYVPGFDYVFDQGQTRYYAYDEDGGLKAGLMDRDGNIVVPAEYDNIGDMKNGLRIVRKNHENGVIDRDGKLLYLGYGEPIIADDGYVIAQ